MEISLIVAMDRGRVIGKDNGLPWRLPADLRHFKRNTVGKAIVMGRKTWESIGRPLPRRHNIIVTSNTDYVAEGCTVVHSFEQAIAAASDAEEVVVIGGATLYREALPLASRIYLTEVHARVEGDTFFPEVDWEGWKEVQRESRAADEKNPLAMDFVLLERVVAGEINDRRESTTGDA